MDHWYQIYGDNFDALFQGNGKCSTADYELLEDGQVFVTNKQIRDDLQDSITGYAYYKNDDCCGYLTVKFLIKFLCTLNYSITNFQDYLNV